MNFRRQIRRLLGDGCAPVILSFHRIADTGCDPWALSVTPSRFEEQMAALKRRRIPLSMRELAGRLEDGTLPAEAVAVTFDDGYADNLRCAKPALEKFGIPATVFLTTGYVGKQVEFWWDELARLILMRHEGAEGTVDVGGRSTAVILPALPHGGGDSTWRAWQPPRTARERLYLEIWNALRVLDDGAREQGLEGIRRLLGRQPPADADLPMTPDQVRQLVNGSALVAVGAHSETHQPLTTLSVDDRRREIRDSRAACEALTGKRIDGFAYPHGDRDAVTADLVRESGLRWACSTRSAAIDRAHFDLFDLPRIQALNWTATELERELNRTRRPS